MPKIRITILDKISLTATDLLPPKIYIPYYPKHTHKDPDAIIVRSTDLLEMEINPTLKALARAGSGTNNIPIEDLTLAGIPVFNTPGANANSVKELVLAGMLMATRNINEALYFVSSVMDTSSRDKEISAAVEGQKIIYKGKDLAGRTIGIIGLGNIGGSLANACIALGMKVIGYDAFMTVDRAWRLSPDIQNAASLEDLYRDASDFITVHVPLTEGTQDMINKKSLDLMKEGITVLNFARAGIINEEDISDALRTGKLHTYVSDFPANWMRNFSPRRVITFPHLGASTENAEENCAVMAVNQLMAFLEDGNITNSVNFPTINMPRPDYPARGYRVAIAHQNIPNMVAAIAISIGSMNINILNMTNQSKEDIAYTLIDIGEPLMTDQVEEISSLGGVLSTRFLN